MKFRFVFFVQCQIAVKSLTRMRDMLTLMSTWQSVMAEEETFLRWEIGTDNKLNIYHRLKIQNIHTAFVVDPHLKMSSVFGMGRLIV